MPSVNTSHRETIKCDFGHKVAFRGAWHAPRSSPHQTTTHHPLTRRHRVGSKARTQEDQDASRQSVELRGWSSPRRDHLPSRRSRHGARRPDAQGSEKPHLADSREPQVHLTHVLVRMPALLLARESDKSDKIHRSYMWSGNSLSSDSQRVARRVALGREDFPTLCNLSQECPICPITL